MTTGKRIRKLRMGQGMRQTDLAQKLHVTPQAVSAWERDETMPAVDKLKDLAFIFHVPIGDLLDESDELTNTGKELSDDTFRVSADLAIEYLSWHQLQTRRSLKAVLISLSLMIAALVVLTLVDYGLHSVVALLLYILLVTASLITTKKFGKKNVEDQFGQIEAASFLLEAEAKELVLKQKNEYHDAARANAIVGALGLMALVIWFFDTAFERGWYFSVGMIIAYMVGFTIIMAMCLPIAQHWLAIRKLLHEVAPTIPTPFDKAFWTKDN